MLTELQIRNFKCWQDTGPLRLAPITVFFGANSGGKSSVGQFLLMLKQTVDCPDRRRVLHTGDKQTPVSLGAYRDFVHGHDPKSDISFEFTWEPANQLVLEDAEHERTYRGSSVRFRSTIGAAWEADGGPIARRAEYELLDGVTFQMGVAMEPEKGRHDAFKLECREYDLKLRRGRPTALPSPVRFYGFPDETTAYFQNTSDLPYLALALENLFRGLFYLGPLRGRLDRLYQWRGGTPEHVGWQGENAVEAILAARGRRFSAGHKHKRRRFEVVLAEWLKRMGLIHSFEVSLIAESHQLYEVRVRTAQGGPEVNITDVGFGISQVLPVLVALLYAPAQSVILMEQPEIHLHPSVQSWLADVFIEAVSLWENGAPRNIQLVVESHSEHFLRRLQWRLAEGRKVTTDKLAAYFCRQNASGVGIMTPLDVDDYGNIRNWPKDFFGDQMGEVTRRVVAQAKRTAAEARRADAQVEGKA